MKIADILIVATIFFLPFYLFKIELFNIPTNILEILALSAIFSFLALNKNFLKKLFFFYKKNIIFSLFVIIFFLSLFLSYLLNSPGLSGLGIIKGWFVIPLIFGLTFYAWAESKYKIEQTFIFLYLSIIAVSLLGIILMLAGHLTYDFRLRGPYLSPNHLAMYLAPGLLIGPYLASRKNLPLVLRFFYLSSFLLLAITLFLTKSSSAVIAIALSLFIYFIFKKNLKNCIKNFLPFLLIILFVLALVTTKKAEYLLLSERSSLSARIEIWKVSAELIKNNPIFGIGPGNFQQNYLEYQKYFPPYQEWAVPQPHNIFLAFWLQSGFFGLIAFIGICFYILKILISKIKKGSELALVVFSIILYILVHGLFDTTYWKNDLAIVFWLLIFMGIRIHSFKN